VLLDLKLIGWTGLAITSRARALHAVSQELKSMGADAALVRISRRDQELQPMPPPGADVIVTARY
jgi:hypothetical protein